MSLEDALGMSESSCRSLIPSGRLEITRVVVHFKADSLPFEPAYITVATFLLNSILDVTDCSENCN